MGYSRAGKKNRTRPARLNIMRTMRFTLFSTSYGHILENLCKLSLMLLEASPDSQFVGRISASVMRRIIQGQHSAQYGYAY